MTDSRLSFNDVYFRSTRDEWSWLALRRQTRVSIIGTARRIEGAILLGDSYFRPISQPTAPSVRYPNFCGSGLPPNCELTVMAVWLLCGKPADAWWWIACARMLLNKPLPTVFLAACPDAIDWLSEHRNLPRPNTTPHAKPLQIHLDSMGTCQLSECD